MTLAYEPDVEGQLRALTRAGADGLELGDGITAGVALHLALMGHATISNAKAGPQRALATVQGVAYARRAVWL